MTFVMHAVNPEEGGTGTIAARMPPISNTEVPGDIQSYRRGPAPSPAQRAPFSSVSGLHAVDEGDEALSMAGKNVLGHACVASPWVPVVKSVLEFAKKSMWKPEVLAQRTTEHAGTHFPVHCTINFEAR